MHVDNIEIACVSLLALALGIHWCSDYFSLLFLVVFVFDVQSKLHFTVIENWLFMKYVPSYLKHFK